MSLKLNVGVSRKVGLPDYGSMGASCSLEFELDASLLDRDPDALHERIRAVYAAAEKAVHDELARAQGWTAPPEHNEDKPSDNNNGNGLSVAVPAAVAGRSAPAPAPTSVATRPANGQSKQVSPSRPATANQVRAIRAIANKQKVDLENLLPQEFGVERPDDLSMSEASQLIDRLKAEATV